MVKNSPPEEKKLEMKIIFFLHHFRSKIGVSSPSLFFSHSLQKIFKIHPFLSPDSENLFHILLARQFQRQCCLSQQLSILLFIFKLLEIKRLYYSVLS